MKTTIKKIILTKKSLSQRTKGFFSFYTDLSNNKLEIKRGVADFFNEIIPDKKAEREIEKINTIIGKQSKKKNKITRISKLRGKKKSKKSKKVLIKFSENYNQEINKVFSNLNEKK